MRLALVALVGVFLTGCRADSDPVPDAKPVAEDVKTQVRQREINEPREFAKRRGGYGGTGASHN